MARRSVRCGRSRSRRPTLGDVGLAGDDEADVRTRLTIRLARGDGVILDRDVAPFHDHLARAATEEEVRAWQADVAPARASLAVGKPVARGRRADGPRRRRLRPPYVPVRAVGLGQELRARPGARAAAARDGPAHRDPRPELGLRAARRAARRRPAGAGGALVGAGARHPGAVGGVARRRAAAAALRRARPRDPGRAAAARPRRRPRGVRGAARAARRVAAGEPVGAGGVRPSRGAAARAPARQPGRGAAGRVGARRRGLAARRARRPGGALPRRRHRVAADARGAGARRGERAPRRVGAPARAAPAAARHRRGPQRLPRGARRRR